MRSCISRYGDIYPVFYPMGYLLVYLIVYIHIHTTICSSVMRITQTAQSQVSVEFVRNVDEYHKKRDSGKKHTTPSNFYTIFIQFKCSQKRSKFSLEMVKSWLFLARF